MLQVLYAGLPPSAINILFEAVKLAFEDVTVVSDHLTSVNLRSKVRLSSKDVSTVLVVLGGKESEICKDIENGLYESDKYYCYDNNEGLINWLNNKYNLDFEYTSVDESDNTLDEDYEDVNNTDTKESECTLDEDCEDIDDTIKYYKDKLKFKENTISVLENRIKELTEGNIDEEDSLEPVGVSLVEFEDLQRENSRLSEELMNIQKQSSSDTSKGSEELKKRLAKQKSAYNEVLDELGDLKVTYSKQAGVLNNKEDKIQELEKSNSTFKDENKELKNSITEYKATITTKDKEISNLKESLETRGTDIKSLEDKVANLVEESSSKDKELSELKETNTGLNDKIKELQNRIEDDNTNLSILNKEKLNLQSKINLMESSSGSLDQNNSDILKEIQDLRNRLAEANASPFTGISESAKPKKSVKVNILRGTENYKNIRFAFAGSTESRRGFYKSFLEEVKQSPKEKYLIVDLVSETFVDYVFEIKKMTIGLKWFNEGNNLESYLSDTREENVKVLSCGVSYINDSYFLCVDWYNRLAELDNCGYKVVIFCGDISSLVGRALHESFASHGNSVIYVIGNSVGCRTVVANLIGLSNAKDSIVAYFDYNSDFDRFYNMVKKTNECRIITKAGRR